MGDHALSCSAPFDIERAAPGWKYHGHESTPATVDISTLELYQALTEGRPVRGMSYNFLIKGRYGATASVFEAMRDSSISDYAEASFFRASAVPPAWKEGWQEGRRIFFPGSVLTGPQGQQAWLYFRWSGSEAEGRGLSRWGYRSLDYPFFPEDLVALF